MSSRAAFLAAQNAGKHWLEANSNWAVIGDVLNPAKPASRVVSSLRDAGKTVHLINPRDTTGQCHSGLSDVGQHIDVVDVSHTRPIQMFLRETDTKILLCATCASSCA